MSTSQQSVFLLRLSALHSDVLMGFSYANTMYHGCFTFTVQISTCTVFQNTIAQTSVSYSRATFKHAFYHIANAL